jgi:hypothetical protein
MLVANKREDGVAAACTAVSSEKKGRLIIEESSKWRTWAFIAGLLGS